MDEEAIMESKISSIEAAPLFIDDTASVNVMQLRSKAIKLKNKYGIKAVVIDYLQLMSGMDSRVPPSWPTNSPANSSTRPCMSLAGCRPVV